MSRATAFLGPRRIASGPLPEVARQLHALPPGAMPLVFDDASGRVIDLDLRGSAEEVAARYALPLDADAAPRGRGRPRLGVTAREVTLLPRQWDWLAAQPGGASVTLRKLVAEAMRADPGPAVTRQAQEASYRFLSAIAGDLPGFEAAARALFAGDAAGFAAQMAGWPADLRDHALRLWPGRDST